MVPEGIVVGEEDVARCWWSGVDPLYIAYHDREWGRPVADDRRLFEKICLEGFQSGLSWITILRKRENFRVAFSHFDFERVANFGSDDVERLVNDAGIVRHRGKIEATINNAQACCDLVAAEGSLAHFVWQFEPGSSERPKEMTYATLMELPKTPASTRLSKELKRRGWRFIGPTTAYAFMQAMGLVNDHLDGCAERPSCSQDRRNFVPPTSPTGAVSVSPRARRV